MSAHAAVSGQPGPVVAEAGQSAGEMRPEGAVDRRHFIVLETDRVLLVGCEALHDQIGNDRCQMVAGAVQGTAIDLGHFMHRQRDRNRFAVQVIIDGDKHLAQVDLFLVGDLHQQVGTPHNLLGMY